MIQYDRLWATMTDRGMTQYKLIKLHGFSAGQIGRMKKNMHVSTHTLETLCRILNCRIEDIVEYTPEEAAPADALTANTALLTADAAAHRPNVNIPAPDPPFLSPRTPRPPALKTKKLQPRPKPLKPKKALRLKSHLKKEKRALKSPRKNRNQMAAAHKTNKLESGQPP